MTLPLNVTVTGVVGWIIESLLGAVRTAQIYAAQMRTR